MTGRSQCGQRPPRPRRVLPTWVGVLVTVPGVLSFVPSPEPTRLLLVGIAATLLARGLAPTRGAVRDELPEHESQPARS